MVGRKGGGRRRRRGRRRGCLGRVISHVDYRSRKVTHAKVAILSAALRDYLM